MNKLKWWVWFVVLSLGCTLTQANKMATVEPNLNPTPIPLGLTPSAMPTATAQTPPPPSEDFFVTITAPAAGSRVNANGFLVTGQQRGSSENNVIVQAQDSSGNILQQVATTAIGELGEIGNWQVTLAPTNAVGTSGRIYAFYESPRDGSQQAFTWVEVTYIGQ